MLGGAVAMLTGMTREELDSVGGVEETPDDGEACQAHAALPA